MTCKNTEWRGFTFKECETSDGYTVKVYEGAKSVASLQAGHAGARFLEVLSVGVVPREDYGRRGIGTKLYELAAAEACRQGRVLASDTARTPYSEAFWRKQSGKRRAICANQGMGGSYLEFYGSKLKSGLPQPELTPYRGMRWPCERWSLRPKLCRAEVSLAGLKRRK
jgi:hypothetical protein